ncbi:MAG: hypothetical protein K2J84_10150 [Bacteroidaceae bacterium]|nr:hypothetical protein [Bacteroidaceae bacterium]
MKKLFLICLILLSVLSTSAETWTPVGQVQWTEGALTGESSSYNKTWKVPVERSDSRPNVFRLQPYASQPLGLKDDNVYVYLHTENPKQVYFEYYQYRNYAQDVYGYGYCTYYNYVWQRCPENGYDSRYYGTIVNNNSIEFPIGSFAIKEHIINTYSQTVLLSDAKYSRYIHKIVFPEGILESQPETWVNVGKGEWEDAFSLIQKKEVSFERSMDRTDVFRCSPYSLSDADTPILIHTENSEKIWLEEFTASNYRFTQQCGENGSSSSRYGKLANGKIEIPSDYFTIVNTSTNQKQNITGEKLVITLPEGYNTPIEDDNGIFMGIISFNDKIDNLPISVLNQYTEPTFINFVNNMEMENATLLYYAVDQAITAINQPTYPDNLSNAVIVTFTDGLDQGSLAMKPELLTSRNYAQHLSERIASTSVKGQKLQTYTIGLKSNDVADDELFMLNLESLSSAPENAHSVTDIEGVQTELAKIYEDLYRQTSQRVVSIVVPMMSHGDRYRFTLDGTTDPAKVNNSEVWIEGVFNITDFSLNDVQYHGFTSASGEKIMAERNGVYLKLTFTDCRDKEQDILEVEKNDIDQWTYIASSDIWQHNIENDKDGKIDIEDVRTSAAIMFVLDCSRSLGDLFPTLQETACSFIDRLAGGDGDLTGVEDVMADGKTVDGNAPVEYYNLQGIRVLNPQKGIFIRRQGNVVSKIMVR